jgi:5'-deoxynucleotidase YfbR-like HD superfamily hydrolase
MDDHQAKITELLKFYLLATKLKDLIRKGQLEWNIERERVESVAEHIYGTCIFALALHSEFSTPINI